MGNNVVAPCRKRCMVKSLMTNTSSQEYYVLDLLTYIAVQFITIGPNLIMVLIVNIQHKKS